MKRYVLGLSWIALLVFMAGCGGTVGGEEQNNTGPTTRFLITLEWPSRGRIAGSSAALSAKVTLKGAKPDGKDLTWTINRDENPEFRKTQAYNRTYESPSDVRLGRWDLIVDFYSEKGAQGIVVLTVRAKVNVEGEGKSRVEETTIRTETPIKSIEVDPGQKVDAGEEKTLTFKAKDARGNLVAVQPGSVIFELIGWETKRDLYKTYLDVVDSEADQDVRKYLKADGKIKGKSPGQVQVRAYLFQGNLGFLYSRVETVEIVGSNPNQPPFEIQVPPALDDPNDLRTVKSKLEGLLSRLPALSRLTEALNTAITGNDYAFRLKKYINLAKKATFTYDSNSQTWSWSHSEGGVEVRLSLTRKATDQYEWKLLLKGTENGQTYNNTKYADGKLTRNEDSNLWTQTINIYKADGTKQPVEGEIQVPDEGARNGSFTLTTTNRIYGWTMESNKTEWKWQETDKENPTKPRSAGLLRPDGSGNAEVYCPPGAGGLGKEKTAEATWNASLSGTAKTFKSSCNNQSQQELTASF